MNNITEKEICPNCGAELERNEWDGFSCRCGAICTAEMTISKEDLEGE